MNWEKLDLHIENLIPGVVLTTILLLSSDFPMDGLSGHEGLLTTAFVAIAYMLGAIGNVLSRLLLDVVCKNTIRSSFMRFFVGDRLESIKPSRSAINKRFSAVITAGLTCGNAWVESELAKRRQTGRILRSTLGPVLFTIWTIGHHLGWRPLRTSVLELTAYLVVLLLFAYAETVIFQEGYRGEQIHKMAEEAAAPLENARNRPAP